MKKQEMKKSKISLKGQRTNEKYLGDILSTDGRNIKNVKARVSKGTGIISRILAMLEGIPFGPFY